MTWPLNPETLQACGAQVAPHQDSNDHHRAFLLAFLLARYRHSTSCGHREYVFFTGTPLSISIILKYGPQSCGR